MLDDNMANEGHHIRLRSNEESEDSDDSLSEHELGAGPQLEPRRPHSEETPAQEADIADTTDEDPTQIDPTIHGM